MTWTSESAAREMDETWRMGINPAGISRADRLAIFARHLQAAHDADRPTPRTTPIPGAEARHAYGVVSVVGRDAGVINAGELAKLRALADAVQSWCAESEGVPHDPSDAELLKALWTFEGDRTEPCPECDGDCGEPCAPCSVEAAHRSLDRFVVEWRKKKGLSP
jgi:hypothetical protein